MPRHKSKGIPRYIHGHRTHGENHYITELKKQGFLTVTDVCKILNIGSTTYCRYENKGIFPKAKRHKGRVRVFTKNDVKAMVVILKDKAGELC